MNQTSKIAGPLNALDRKMLGVWGNLQPY